MPGHAMRYLPKLRKATSVEGGESMPLFIVYELELDETRSGGRGEQAVDVDAPIKFKANVIGCFIAKDGPAACRLAAAAVRQPGRFIAARCTEVRKIELGEEANLPVTKLVAEVEGERERALEKARRNNP